ncbi:hypothetical protein ACMATS_05780 [Streptoverticillium reticulum]|uniref:hypothetical protein n=1 Tax=Streptoverticillium reticulum TaxID=1433415 RepID=UPI0039BFB755
MHRIEAQQVYQSLDPRDNGRQIRVTEYAPGANKAVIVDAATGKRPRMIEITSLHAGPLSKLGKPLKRGYALVREPEHRSGTTLDALAASAELRIVPPGSTARPGQDEEADQ